MPPSDHRRIRYHDGPNDDNKSKFKPGTVRKINVSYNKIEWAIDSLGASKIAKEDNIFLALLQ